eukprot:6197218-Pleurochrysis_carterae.AAC.2
MRQRMQLSSGNTFHGSVDHACAANLIFRAKTCAGANGEGVQFTFGGMHAADGFIHAPRTCCAAFAY